MVFCWICLKSTFWGLIAAQKSNIITNKYCVLGIFSPEKVIILMIKRFVFVLFLLIGNTTEKY